MGGVVCELHFAVNQALWRSGQTGSDGRVAIAEQEGGILPGDYILVIKPPTGFVMASGQSSSIPLTVRERETNTINVQLANSP